MLLFGGIKSDSTSYNDLWLYDPTLNTITLIVGDLTTGSMNTALLPAGRAFHAAVMSLNESLIIYGGFGATTASAGTQLNDVWHYGLCNCYQGSCKISVDNTQCQTCNKKSFGATCDTYCNCVNSGCNDGLTGTGACNACNTGFHGTSCEKRCLDDACVVDCDCLDETLCAQKDLRCTDALISVTDKTLNFGIKGTNNQLNAFQVQSSTVGVTGNLMTSGNFLVNNSTLTMTSSASNVKGDFNLINTTATFFGSSVTATGCSTLNNFSSIVVDMSAYIIYNTPTEYDIVKSAQSCLTVEGMFQLTFIKIPAGECTNQSYTSDSDTLTVSYQRIPCPKGFGLMLAVPMQSLVLMIFIYLQLF